VWRVIVGACLFIFVAGFGFATLEVLNSQSGERQSPAEVDRGVSDLLRGIPQHGATLGSPDAPLTLQIYADLECPTVRRFMINKFPGILKTWVRPGIVKLEYLSLETDSIYEPIFIRQEVAALAAGRQGRLWNFAETFVREQGREDTRYATERFLTGIASRVDVDESVWRHDRKDLNLFNRVVLADHHARAEGLRGTPSLLIGKNGGAITQWVGSNIEGEGLPGAPSLARYVALLRRTTPGFLTEAGS
jgi:protein-disulfide isomerase